MVTGTMTPRRRWLAALDMEPVDRLPFWPKLDGSYARAQAAPFGAMANEGLHEWIGSDQHTGIGGFVKATRRKTSLESHRSNGEHREVFRAPAGSLERISRFDEMSQSWHPVKMPVNNVQDVRVLAEWYADESVELDAEALERAGQRAREIGEKAVITDGIGKSPLMNWVEYLAGVANAHFLLADHRREVEALFEVMHRNLLRRAEIILAHSPADMTYMIENTSTTLISPEQYRRYCLRHVGQYAKIARAHGRRMVLHMCGHLRTILPDVNKIGAAAFEAFTTPPVGNASLLDGRAGCPQVCLIGGTNAALWLRPVEEIIAEVDRQLEALPHHRGLVITSAGVMPPAATPQKIRAVCDWVKAYPARMDG